MAWYRAGPIAAFGGRSAESLVKKIDAAAVRDDPEIVDCVSIVSIP